MAQDNGKFIFLGTGSSMGVPVVGCQCSVCTCSSTFNKRKRCAAIIDVGPKKILLDAGPEIRIQLLEACITDIDGAIITHSHFDHIAGVDDLKSFYYKKMTKLPMLLNKQAYDDFRLRNTYLMDPKSQNAQGLYFDFKVQNNMFVKGEFAGLEFTFLEYKQNNMDVLGFKIGNLAYLSDIKQYSQRLISEVQGIDVLVISALRKKTSTMHLSIDEAVAFARSIGAKRTYLTHIAHEVDYELDSKDLPKGISFAHDGLHVPFTYEKGII